MLNHSVLHVLQVLDGVDALPPVLADVGEGVLDVLDVQQGAVQLRQSRAHAVQLRLDGCLEVVSVAVTQSGFSVAETHFNIGSIQKNHFSGPDLRLLRDYLLTYLLQ